jgi:excisionase family DNA binding protein
MIPVISGAPAQTPVTHSTRGSSTQIEMDSFTHIAPMQLRPLMNTAEAAEYLRVSVRLVQKLVQTRKLRPARIGRRLIFQRSELDRFVALQCALAA